MSFQRHEKNNLVWLTSSLLDSPSIHHGFSTRKGGVSPAPRDSLNLDERGDSPVNVQENFRRLCGALEMDEKKVVLSKQVHKDDVRLVTKDDCGKGLWRPRDYDSADALICATPGIPLVVFSADCGVILLYDAHRGVIGAVHAGWRGTAANIVGKAAREMVRQFGCDPAHICAAIGPSIGSCCFETDADVPAALRNAMGQTAEPFMRRQSSKWHIDLKGINRHWLEQEGVRTIDTCADCTACRPDLYWSHRKMGLARGEQVAIISL